MNIQKTQGKTLQGVVISDKLDKTRTVRVTRRDRHPLYGKIMTKNTQFLVHDELNQSEMGDTVLIQEAKPISKRKRWQVLELIERAGLSNPPLLRGGEQAIKK